MQIVVRNGENKLNFQNSQTKNGIVTQRNLSILLKK